MTVEFRAHAHKFNVETQFNDDFQIAILEAKGGFQKVIDGVPVLTDELPAQVVGEALALRLSQTRSLYGKECVPNVLAVYICLQELTSGCSRRDYRYQILRKNTPFEHHRFIPLPV